MSNKHPRPDKEPVPLPDDLDENPGIGQSKGIFARTDADPRLIAGESTVEGDRGNDTSPSGRADARTLGRTNK